VVLGAAMSGVGAPAVLAQSKKPIRIGCTHDLTGALSPDGTWNDRAVKAAVKKLTGEGGIDGRPIELFVEDSETNTQTALRKFRSLVLQNEVDFVVGATHSGHNIATAPLAKELRTPYFASGTALETTTDKGNRWIFRGVNNIRQQMKAMALVAMEQLKPRYYFVGADYSWGRSLVKESKTFVSERGGKIIGETFIPLGSSDISAYLNNLNPSQFDTLVLGMTSGDAMRFLRQAHDIGLTSKVTIIGNIAVTSGSNVPDLGAGAAGSWYTTMYPRRSEFVPAALKEYDAYYRSAIGVTPEGTDKDTGRAANMPYSFVAWQAVHIIKQVIEKSGWKSRDDHPKFIQTLEGLEMKAGRDFPQGDSVMRAEDHQIVHDQYIERIEDEKLKVIATVDKAKLGYPPESDYRKEALG
jgi:branched-chain amino acid transport system substrate-binding protein